MTAHEFVKTIHFTFELFSFFIVKPLYHTLFDFIWVKKKKAQSDIYNDIQVVWNKVTSWLCLVTETILEEEVLDSNCIFLQFIIILSNQSTSMFWLGENCISDVLIFWETSNLLVANMYWIGAFQMHVYDPSLFEETPNRSNI